MRPAGDFLRAGSAAVAVGSDLVDGKTIREGRFDVIEERARRFVEVIEATRAEMRSVH